jgi:hypothetical protein
MKPASGQEISGHALSGDFFNSLSQLRTFEGKAQNVSPLH